MNRQTKHFHQRIFVNPRLICILLGLSAFDTNLKAQYQELTNVSSDPNQKHGSLPVSFNKDSAQGSPYFTSGWLRGVVELNNSKQYPEPGHNLFLNYDKLHGHLIATDGIGKIWTYGNDSIKRFILTDGDSIFLFEKVPFISQSIFLQPLVNAEKGYSLYRRLITKFTAADYRSEGYYTLGTNHDRYEDFYVYYIVYPDNKTFRKLFLNKKDILKSFKPEASRLDSFFSKNNSIINEQTLVAIVDFLNNPKAY
jgi:hypothetical protein